MGPHFIIYYFILGFCINLGFILSSYLAFIFRKNRHLFLLYSKHVITLSWYNLWCYNAEPFGGNRRTPKCKYCGKVIHVGITRLKQHIAHISGQVEICRSVPAEVSQNIKLYMSNASNEKKKKKKGTTYKFFNEEHFYEIDEADYDEIEEVKMIDFEKWQMKHAMRESLRFFLRR